MDRPTRRRRSHLTTRRDSGFGCWQPNGGISMARNRALQQAAGSVLTILDGDDVWVPQYSSARWRSN
jgi:hypothetical protein